MNKGFTLIEIMVIVAIALIVSTGGILAIGDRLEKNAILTVKSELPTYIRNVVDRSFSEGIQQTITITESGEAVLTKSRTSGTTTENLYFPKSLKYTINPATITVGEKGEFVDNFVLTVKTKKDVTVMTITGTNMGGTATNQKGINLGKITVQ